MEFLNKLSDDDFDLNGPLYKLKNSRILLITYIVRCEDLNTNVKLELYKLFNNVKNNILSMKLGENKLKSYCNNLELIDKILNDNIQNHNNENNKYDNENNKYDNENNYFDLFNEIIKKDKNEINKLLNEVKQKYTDIENKELAECKATTYKSTQIMQEIFDNLLDILDKF